MSEFILQRHGDAEWPECWLFYQRSDTMVPGQKLKGEGSQCGSLTKFERNRLTYTCACEATFTREPGFQNEEARAWVAEHREHLPDPPTT